jgi:hypothetical protein
MSMTVRARAPRLVTAVMAAAFAFVPAALVGAGKGSTPWDWVRSTSALSTLRESPRAAALLGLPSTRAPRAARPAPAMRGASPARAYALGRVPAGASSFPGRRSVDGGASFRSAPMHLGARSRGAETPSSGELAGASEDSSDQAAQPEDGAQGAPEGAEASGGAGAAPAPAQSGEPIAVTITPPHAAVPAVAVRVR